MFPEAVVVRPMAGSCSVAPAGTDQLDLEAAEQLIQLSGGDGAAAAEDDAGGSESRSADSVNKCGKKEMEEKKEAAVESRRRNPAAAGKDGNGGGESDTKVKSVGSFACSATAADVEEEEDKVVVVESCRWTAAERFPAGKKDRDGGVLHGEARKRPRYRLLADIYRDTEPRRLSAAGGGEAHADPDPPEGETKKEKKRAADGVIAVDANAKASKARRSAQLARTRM